MIYSPCIGFDPCLSREGGSEYRGRAGFGSGDNINGLKEQDLLNFIVNPNSGGERGYKLWKNIEHYLIKRKVEYKSYITDGPMDATRIASELTAKDEEVHIIAVGGDGTVNEVLEGVRISPLLTMGYIPTGSGNDLARGLKLPRNPSLCLRRILRPKAVELIDYGVISYGEGKHRRFLVSAGIGFDGQICYSLNERRMRGAAGGLPFKKFIYVFLGIKQIFLNKTFKGHIILDGIKRVEFNHLVLVASHIHPTQGGGFRFAPKADNKDGELSVCIIHQKSKLRLARILLSALLGNHMKYAGVRSYECNELTIHAEVPTAVHTDGEILGMFETIELRCIKQKLRFIR